MTHPQHTPREPARPVSEAERSVARRHLAAERKQVDDWYQTEAPDHLIDAVHENLHQDQAKRIVTLIRQAERHGAQGIADRELGRIMREVISPYLDEQCERECNDEQ